VVDRNKIIHADAVPANVGRASAAALARPAV